MALQGVEVAPGDPHLFWSVAEDGDVRQFDTRCRHAAQRLLSCPIKPSAINHVTCVFL